jgi:thioredoxin reductase
VTARERRALVVVGGGPAGLAAASEAHRAGLQTLLIEQRSSVGATDVETCVDSAVWGIWGRDLAVCGAGGRNLVVAFDQVVFATGSYERPVAFPGWTLPGVMTVDEALRSPEHGVEPGRRVVVAGDGQPLACAVDELRARGLNVDQIVDASAQPGRIVVRAEGAQRLERIVTAAVDADWFVHGDQQVSDVDTLVLAFGHLPEDRLARLAGCEHSASAYVAPSTVHDEWMRTTVPGVLVAGDAGGIVGPAASIEQGRLAGLAAAVGAGRLSPSDAERQARLIRQRLEAETMQSERPRPGLFALAEPDTIICRCEGVTRAQITARLFDGVLEPGPVIAETRAGMGLCQGRKCTSLIAATISRHAGQPIDRIPAITPRPPVVPVPLGVVAERPPVFERT